jgi:hypothetical protein
MLSLPPLSCLQLAARPAHHLWWAGQSPGLNVPLTPACVLSELWPFALCHLWVRQNLAAVVPIRPCVPSQRPTMAFYTSWATARSRWWVEALYQALKDVVGSAQQPVTKDVGRVERSVAIALLAYLLVLWLQA